MGIDGNLATYYLNKRFKLPSWGYLFIRTCSWGLVGPPSHPNPRMEEHIMLGLHVCLLITSQMPYAHSCRRVSQLVTSQSSVWSVPFLNFQFDTNFFKEIQKDFQGIITEGQDRPDMKEIKGLGERLSKLDSLLREGKKIIEDQRLCSEVSKWAERRMGGSQPMDVLTSLLVGRIPYSLSLLLYFFLHSFLLARTVWSSFVVTRASTRSDVGFLTTEVSTANSR